MAQNAGSWLDQQARDVIARTVWQLLDRRQRACLLGLQFLAVLMAIATVTGIAAVVPFFSVLANPAGAGHSLVLRLLRQHLGLHPAAPELALVLGAGFIGLVVLASAINLAGTLLMNRFACAVGDSFNITLFEDYLTRGYDFHLLTRTATLTARLLHETSRVTTGILQSGLTLGTNLVAGGLIVVSMIVVDPITAAAALLTLGGTYVLIYLAVRGKLLRNGVTESGHYAERTLIIGESLGAIREILLAQAQPAFTARYTGVCRSISRTALSTLAISQTPRYALEVATVCALVGSAIDLGRHGQAHGSWIASLSFMGFAVYRLLPALQQAFAALVRIRADRPALATVAADVCAARARRPARREAALQPPWHGRPHTEIRLDDISYRYPSGEAEGLCGVSLRIAVGAIVGLVGHNGSGKSTLLDILAGVLVPRSGQVVVDGVPLDAVNRAAWQATLAYVPQRTFLLDAPLEENIAFGATITARDRERLQSAIAVARLRPEDPGWSAADDERLGERGSRLSGGQRQRVGIARALYRDASVLIMDEATSELDVAAEEGIIDALQTIRAGRTIILTAHRLTSLRHCDVILELEKGRIVRSSTYPELCARRGEAPLIGRRAAAGAHGMG
ncbi:MAG: ABC transporter ATP-binding protein [Steroidobacteraceae bacterium]